MSRNQIIIVSLAGFGLGLAIFLAISLKDKEPQDLPPAAKGNTGETTKGASNAPARTNTTPRSVPSTNTPPTPTTTPQLPAQTNDPLLRAIRQTGSLKAALASLGVDHRFDAGGNLLWLGLGNLKVGDDALAQLTGETKIHALYLYDTSVTDAGLKHIAGLSGLRILLLTASPVTDAGVAELEAALPDCVVIR